MHTPATSFSLAEKLAIVHALDLTILADNRVHKKKLDALSNLINSMDCDSNFIVQARNVTLQQVLLILKDMPHDKKVVLATLLDGMAIADGYLHEREISFISQVLMAINLE